MVHVITACRTDCLEETGGNIWNPGLHETRDTPLAHKGPDSDASVSIFGHLTSNIHQPIPALCPGRDYANSYIKH